jgi:hypothetical protein
MKSYFQKLKCALVALIAALSLTGLAFAASPQTFTGIVSDAMCGAQHQMEGSAAQCTRECVAKGSKYALVVGDKVYTLDTSDKAALATLDQQAGAKVTVTGALSNDTITVHSVKAVH